MGSTTYCDVCNKKQTSGKDWVTIAVYGLGEKMRKKLGSSMFHYDICISCSDKVTGPLFKILSSKKKG